MTVNKEPNEKTIDELWQEFKQQWDEVKASYLKLLAGILVFLISFWGSLGLTYLSLSIFAAEVTLEQPTKFLIVFVCFLGAKASIRPIFRIKENFIKGKNND